MKKFSFNLEPLFEYRQRLEELSKKDFAEALQRLSDEEARLGQLKNDYIRTSDEFDELKEKGAPPETLSLYGSYIPVLKDHIAAQEEILKMARAELEKRRALLETAMKDRKAVETIRDKSKASYVREFDREEQKQNDEVASNRSRTGGL